MAYDLMDKAELIREIQSLKDQLEQLQDNQDQLASFFLSDHQFRESIIEGTSDFFIIISYDGKIMRMNRSMLDALGFEEKELIGKDYLTNLIPAAEREKLREVFQTLTHKHVKTYNENHVLTKDGHQLLVEWYGFPVFGTDGSFSHFFGIGANITEKRQTKKQLEESQRTLMTLFGNLPGMAYRCRNDNNFTMEFISDGCTAITGYANQELLYNQTISYASLINPEFREYVSTEVQHALKYKTPFQLEYKIKTKSGQEKWIWERGRGVFSASGELNALEGLILDITQEKQATDALAAEKERLDVTLRSIGEGVIATNTAGKINIINTKAAELTGWAINEAIGQPLMRVFHIIAEKTREDLGNPCEMILKAGNAVFPTDRTLLISKDNRERVISYSGSPIRSKTGEMVGIVLVFRDVTEKAKMEEEMLRAQKLESIGILAGGIAHDFNNILTSVMGNISLARLHGQGNHKLINSLNDAEESTLRAKELTQQLLTFSAGGAPIREVASITDLIRESTKFALHGSNVKSLYDLPDDLWSVEIDKGQISQVINGLIFNAIQAMPEGGIVKVSAKNITIGTNDNSPFQPGDYVRIEVADEGVGIPKEHQQKIFDPYFTTKQTGSGLGLAITYSIVKKHNGFVDVQSEVGKGTSITIHLPATKQKAWFEGQYQPDSSKIKTAAKILIMDDEEMIQRVAKELLTHMGYNVDCAKDGREALAMYDNSMKSGQPYSAVVMDLTIPGGMGGQETISHLLKMDPDAVAVVSSGYSNDPIMSDYEKFGFKGVVAKPYRIEELNDTLLKVIASKKQK